MDTTPLIKSTETTSVVAYKSDLKRIALLKINNDLVSQQETIKFLLNYYHDNQLTKNQNQSTSL